MQGFHFSGYDPRQQDKSRFEQLLDLFMQLLTYTSGDVAEALQWQAGTICDRLTTLDPDLPVAGIDVRTPRR